MVPMRTSTVFKSRWMALIWAAGIIWFAVDFVQSKEPPANTSANGEAANAADSDGAAATNQDVETAANALGF